MWTSVLPRRILSLRRISNPIRPSSFSNKAAIIDNHIYYGHRSRLEEQSQPPTTIPAPSSSLSSLSPQSYRLQTFSTSAVRQRKASNNDVRNYDLFFFDAIQSDGNRYSSHRERERHRYNHRLKQLQQLQYSKRNEQHDQLLLRVRSDELQWSQRDERRQQEQVRTRCCHD
jgi:hypothetical protein